MLFDLYRIYAERSLYRRVGEDIGAVFVPGDIVGDMLYYSRRLFVIDNSGSSEYELFRIVFELLENRLL